MCRPPQAASRPAMAVNLSSLGVDKRWHCLEVCGGAGLVWRWLSAKFGADGRVVGTDIDPRFLQEPRTQRVAVTRPLTDARRYGNTGCWTR